jgi:hypothetical protein
MLSTFVALRLGLLSDDVLTGARADKSAIAIEYGLSTSPCLVYDMTFASKNLPKLIRLN